MPLTRVHSSLPPHATQSVRAPLVKVHGGDTLNVGLVKLSVNTQDGWQSVRLSREEALAVARDLQRAAGGKETPDHSV